MKKAVILHGTDGNPDINWLPWAKKQLLEEGYEVWVPHMPENHTPNRFTYEKFLKESDWDFTDNLLIGHSSGATTVLNLLQSDWFPKVNTVILVGTFLNQKLVKDADWFEPGQFDNLFPEEFDIEKIKAKANHFYFIHGDDDPFCDISDARAMCQQLDGSFVTVPGGHHLGDTRTKLPEIIPILK